MSVLTALTLVATACGSDDSTSTPDVATVTPASAAAAPTTATATPAGFVIAIPGGPGRALAVSGDTVAVVDAAGTGLLRFVTPSSAEQSGAQPVITVRESSLLTGLPDGAFLLAGPNQVSRVAADGAVQTFDTGIPTPTALAHTAGGQTLIGTATGHVIVLGSDMKQVRDIGGFVRVDDITVSPSGADLPGEQIVVLDRAQSSVTPINLDDGSRGAALRAGNGATNTTVDRYGRVLAANTRDGEIVGFFGSPLVMRFRYPVSGGPYAVDYDDKTDLMLVSATADNEVVGFDLSDGEPSEKSRFPAVAQPDSLAVDDASGTVYVLSGRDGGLQVVPVAAR